MKMDLDLIRKILLYIEDNGKLTDSIRLRELSLLEYPLEEIAYNLKLLEDAGYIEGKELKTPYIYDYMIKRMTIYGHQYLDNVRNDNIWEKTKSKLKEVSGTASLKIVSDLATSILKNQLGI